MSDKSVYAGTDELTSEQLDRQDHVDNAIFALLTELAGTDLKWDSEIIGNVRDAIQNEIVRLGIKTDHEFYPYFED